MSTNGESVDDRIARYERLLIDQILAAGKQHAEESNAVGACRDRVAKLERDLNAAEHELMVSESRRDRVGHLALEKVRNFPAEVDAMRADIAADENRKEAQS